MGAIWSFIVETKFQHPPAAAVLLVAGLYLCGRLALRAAALLSAVRLSRRAIERGYPVEAASGKEFYFKVPVHGSQTARQPTIRKPRLTASGARLRSLRSEKGFTLANLSSATNIPVSRLSALETGRAQLVVEDIEAITHGLQLTADISRSLRQLAKSDTVLFVES